MSLQIKPKQGCKFDLVSLGEVMLRLDPGDGRVATTRRFDVWEGGGEYNVARGLQAWLRLRPGIRHFFRDNPVGWLVQSPIFPGGVGQSYVRWVPFDGI